MIGSIAERRNLAKIHYDKKALSPLLRLFARVKEIPETPSLLSKHCNEKCYHYREQKYEAKGKERKEMPLSH